jgi:heme-degrading monooxygenase HmoA
MLWEGGDESQAFAVFWITEEVFLEWVQLDLFRKDESHVELKYPFNFKTRVKHGSLASIRTESLISK